MVENILWICFIGFFMGLSRCLVIHTDFRHKPWKRVYNCSLMYCAIIFVVCFPQALSGAWTWKHMTGIIVIVMIGELISWIYWRWLNPPR